MPAPRFVRPRLVAAALACAAGLCGFLAVTAQDLRDPRFKAADEKAIRAVLEDQTLAWNNGDLDGFMAGYWKSDELRFYSGGDVTSGWQATLDRYKKRYKGDGKEMGRLTFSDVEVQVLSADAAVVRGRWKLEFTKSKDKPSGLYTLVVRKRPEGWRIVHDHTSAAEPK